MDTLIDIIIPVYNKENTIEKCIDSVLNQTYSNFRIIIVDDGSTDKSYELCSKYKDERIKLIRQNNSGVSAARNRGLENLLGEKVAFIDADDFVQPTYLSDLLKYKEYDLVVQGYMTYLENGNVCGKIIPEKQMVKKSDFGNTLFNTNIFKFMTIPWNKLFDSQIIIQNNIKFRNINLGEDICFVFDYLQYVDQVILCQDVNYCYVQTEGSLSRRIVNNLWEIQKDINQYCRKNFYPLYKNTWSNMCMRAVKCTLAEAVKDKERMKRQIVVINADDDFKKLRFWRLDGMLNKLLFFLVKIKAYAILQFMFCFT